MKKIGFLCMAMVLILGSLGMSYAKWSEILTIEGVVNTGVVDVQFSNQLSNDPGDPGASELDPMEFGQWYYGPGPDNDPTVWRWGDERYDKDVGAINCELVDEDGNPEGNGGYEMMRITMLNGYPSYYGSIAYTIDNIGTIPVKIASIKLKSVSKEGMVTGEPDLDLLACETIYVDADAGTCTTTPDPVDGPWFQDFSIHLSDLAVGQQIDPPNIGPGPDFIVGDLGIHVEQGADELTMYDFVIEIEAAQWNEVP
jgi:hypothetical protein